MRRVAGLHDQAPTGADCVLLDRVVVRALRRFDERHVNLLALISWMGFRQTSIPCARHARTRGTSGWTMWQRLTLLVDSVVGFSHLPIRVMLCAGLLTALLGLGYAVVVAINALTGTPPAGWSSLMVVVLLIGGMQMVMFGVLGEYLWRTLEETRRRPRYLIEATTPVERRARGFSPVVLRDEGPEGPSLQRRQKDRHRQQGNEGVSARSSRKRWATLAGVWHRALQSVAAPDGTRSIEAYLRAHLPADAPGRWLDVGAGSRSRLAPLGIRPVAVDVSWTRASAARAGGALAVVASADALPFADQTFHTAASVGLLHHLPDASATAALAELVRVTSPDGHLVVIDAVLPNRSWRRPVARLVRALDRGRWMRHQPRLEHLLSGTARWSCERITYARTGLEAIVAVRTGPALGDESPSESSPLRPPEGVKTPSLHIGDGHACR